MEEGNVERTLLSQLGGACFYRYICNNNIRIYETHTKHELKKYFGTRFTRNGEQEERGE